MSRIANDQLADAIRETLISPNESDANWEPANVVDAIANAGRNVRAGLERLAEAITTASADHRRECRRREVECD